MGGSSFFTKAGMPGYDPLRNKVFGIGDKSATPADSINSLPVPLPAKPVTSANPEVIQAENDYARSALMKKSVKKTVIAGDTGGYKPVQMLGM
jgi:hypothetical protein